MPIPKYDGSPEKEWISKCMGDIPLDEYTQEQALAICYKQMEMEEVQLESIDIPIEIIGDNEEKILEYLPDIKSGETEDAYLNRCVIVLYPEYYDEQGAYSLCADKYQRIITKSDTGTTEFNINKIAEMKAAIKGIRNYQN